MNNGRALGAADEGREEPQNLWREWENFVDGGPWLDSLGKPTSSGIRAAICKAELQKGLQQVTMVPSEREALRAHLVVCPHVSNEVLRIIDGGNAVPPGDATIGDVSSSDESVEQDEIVEVPVDDADANVVLVGQSADDNDLEAPVRIVFSAPRIVTAEPLLRMSSVELVPGEALVRAEVSAVSAGTEMLVYRGNMPGDIPTDATLDGATGEQSAKPFEYPSSYGYAIVGRVVAVHQPRASSRKRRRLDDGGEIKVGSRVFAFREHASWFVSKSSDLIPVPETIDARDASFLPNVETALSLAMDAAPLPGENVAVVGQGVVGLLLVTVLKMCYGQTRVIAIDALQDRLKASRTCAGADASVLVDVTAEPGSQIEQSLRETLPEGDRDGVDVSIDVSGTGEGLDTAIRATRDGGRVIIGSWFGSKEVSLSCLGGRFHRSHVSLFASQVSSIPPGLAGRWSKARRFRLAWQLIPLIRPSSRFPVSLKPAASAPSVYDEIDKGEHLQVLFTY